MSRLQMEKIILETKINDFKKKYNPRLSKIFIYKVSRLAKRDNAVDGDFFSLPSKLKNWSVLWEVQ